MDEEEENEKKMQPMSKMKNVFTELEYMWQFGAIIMLGVLMYYLDSQFGYFGTAFTKIFYEST